MTKSKTSKAAELAELRARLEEAEQTLEAIRSGKVDALVVQSAAGERVYTLEGADHRYRRIVEGMTEGALLVNREGLILYANSCFANLVGTPLDQVLGTQLDRFFPNEARARFEQVMAASEQGRGAHAETSLCTASGKIVPVRLSATESEPERGTRSVIITDLTTVIRDLQARLETERALARSEASERQFRELTDALATAVTQRTEALQEAERVSRAKDEFLATMSHELRTPLNAMLGWATLLMEDAADATQLQRGLAAIHRNAHTQTRLVSDLLDVSRIISGKLRLMVKKTSVSTVVQAAVDVVRQAADAKGISLVVAIDPSVGSLVADPDRLQQIVWNLVSNAVKFTPPRGSVTVTAERAASFIRLRVQDSGLGIPAEHLPYIFERLRQVDGTSTRHHGGLGLGLAIVRHLAEAHGGTVVAHSDGPGKGAAFTVELPIHAVHVSEVEPEIGAAKVKERPSASRVGGLHGRRILVVEDDEDALELLRVVLEGAGASFAGATRGAQALEETSDRKFDVIISDIAMPEMDGYMFMRRFRSRVAASDTPAIALTAYAREEDAVIALNAGYQEHLTKPVDAAALIATIQKLAPRA